MTTLPKFTKSEEEIESTYQFIMRRRKEQQQGKEITKDDKKREDRLELTRLWCDVDISKQELQSIEIELEKSKAETKRLKKNLKKQIKKVKKYEDQKKKKWELYRENYGKFRQLRLLIK